MKLLPIAVTVLASAFPLAAQAAKNADAWGTAVATFTEQVARPSLWKRTLARQKLADTLDARAIDVLMKTYAKPEEPVDRNRYLIASIVMRAFRTKADETVLAAWRKKYAKPEDAWLWYESLRPTAQKHVDELREQALGKGDVFLRATALEALADAAAQRKEPEGLPALCLGVLADLPKKDVERAVLIESVARIVAANRTRIRTDTWLPVASALIDLFDDEATPQRTKVVLSRMFASALNVQNLGFEAHWWRTELERKGSATKPQTGRTQTVPFHSIRTVGFRFVYVIDASDSMLRRVSDREKRDLGPTTGNTPKPADGPDTGFVPKESELDWNRIITRFDVGREFVRQSLLTLQPEHSFAVVLFGDDAEPLNATPKLVPATPQNVRAAIAELEGIVEGKPTAERPDGVLRGKTNLHAGLVRAFEITRSGVVRKAEYVDAKAMTEGCDSIFLLSDGAPSWDDYVALDTPDPDDQAGDPETGVKHTNTPRLWFQGPYAHPPYDYLTQDIERMNLFRKAEIHCVGIGEANHQMLGRIAEIGGGRALKIEGETKGR